MRPAPPRLALPTLPTSPTALPAALLALLLTGCTMTSSSDPSPSPAARGPLVAEDVVRLDLREPPTREEAGFADGRDSLVLERVGEAIDVEITLPSGVLKTEAFGVVLSGLPGQTQTDAARMVVLNRRLADIDAVRSELLEEADVLGLDPAAIQSFAEQVGDPPSDTDNRVLNADPARLPQAYVEVRHSSAEGWVLTYSFTFPDSV